ncbi:uncharacterized protein V6R79_022437 [Siganus canaliculatus]
MSEAVKCVGDEISGKDLAGLKVAEIMERPSHAFATGAYAGTHEDESSLYAGAGLGYARAEWKAFDAEARGPTFGAGLTVSNSAVKAMAKAELASAAVTAGPTTFKLGLAADTGVGVGNDGVEAKVLGTGFTIGRRTEISLFGSSIGFKFCKLQDLKMSGSNAPVRVEVNGPSAGFDVEASDAGAKVMARAELASTTVTAGAATAKLGLAANTGVGVGDDGVEAKVLGTGFTVGRKIEVSLFGTSLGFKLW